MLNGMHLSLMIGPVVPMPVSQEVLDALTNVRVITSTDERVSGFELTFTLSTRSPLHTVFLLSGGAPIPLIRVIITVTINGTPEVLMDGVMTQHEIQPGSDASHATLIVKGKDLTAVMDYIEFKIPYPAMPAEARVAGDAGQIRHVRDNPKSHPEHLDRRPYPGLQDPQPARDRSQLYQAARQTSGLCLLSRPRAGCREPVSPIGVPR